MNKRGVAGLGILVSVIVIMVVIGLVIFIFTFLSGALSEQTAETIIGSVANESVVSFTDGSGTALSVEPLSSLQISNAIVEGCA